MLPNLDAVFKMMDFLEVDSYVIPHYHLPLPPQADGEHYRPEKVFRLHNDGTMTYHGQGVGSIRMVPKFIKHGPITITNIKPSDRWIERAYIHILSDVHEEVERRAKKAVMSRISELKKVKKLILKFNSLDFVE